MASKYQEFVFRLLRALFDEQKQEWSSWQEEEGNRPESERPVALRTHQYISGWHWAVVNEGKLQSLLAAVRKQEKSGIDFSSEKLILFLPPFPNEQREFVPAVSLRYEPAKECIEMRVGMYTLQDDGQPCGFAFRLESPTSQCKDTKKASIHDFYHVQLVKELGYGPKLGMPSWLPDRQPAIYIRADGPVEAILNLILSLYGARYFNDFLKKHKSRLNIKLSQIPSFSQVIDGIS